MIGKPCAGYTLLCYAGPEGSPTLVDMLGRVVHTWRADPERVGESWFMRRLPNGHWMNLVYYIPSDVRAPAALGPNLGSDFEFQAVLTRDSSSRTGCKQSKERVGMTICHRSIRGAQRHRYSA